MMFQAFKKSNRRDDFAWQLIEHVFYSPLLAMSDANSKPVIWHFMLLWHATFHSLHCNYQIHDALILEDDKFKHSYFCRSKVLV